MSATHDEIFAALFTDTDPMTGAARNNFIPTEALKKANEKIKGLQERVRKLEEQLHKNENTARQANEAFRRERDLVSEECEAYREANHSLQQQLLHTQEAVTALQKDFSSATTNVHGAKEKEYEQGTSYIATLQRLLYHLGASSVLALLDHFDNLTSVIVSTATKLSNIVVRKETDAFDDEITWAVQSVTDQLGESCAVAITSQKDGEVTPALLRVLFQVLIVWAVYTKGAVEPVSELRVHGTAQNNNCSDRLCHTEIPLESTTFFAFKAVFFRTLGDIFKSGNISLAYASQRKELEGDLEKLFNAGRSLTDAMVRARGGPWKHIEVGTVGRGVFPLKASEADEHLELWSPGSIRMSNVEQHRLLGTLLPGLKFVTDRGKDSEDRLTCIIRPSVLSEEALDVINTTHVLKATADSRGDRLSSG